MVISVSLNVVKFASGWRCLTQPPEWACEGICVRSVMDMAQQRMEEALGQHTSGPGA
jgi:hypothetical protein